MASGEGGGVRGGRQLVEISEFVFSTGNTLRMIQNYIALRTMSKLKKILN